MKKIALICFITMKCCVTMIAQSSISKAEGSCGSDLKWTFDGVTLAVNCKWEFDGATMDNYDVTTNIAPWIKKKCNVKRVVIGENVKSIGSCAFANCKNLQEVVFQGQEIQTIGWGAFLNCERLHNIALPINLKNIETIAFANCSSLSSVEIPEECRVGDQAFISCSNLQSVAVHPTALLGSLVFASEKKDGDKVVGYTMYNGEIRRLPPFINEGSCEHYGLAKDAVEKVRKNRIAEEVDQVLSDVDKDVPPGYGNRLDTYALIIGNQNYRFASDVPYAIHDARIFSEYCKKTLGIPVSNIHTAEDATKQMILEEELQDWMNMIPNREDKKLIVYYAGHGVPDVENKNKAYILPTDVRGNNPKRGIALDDLYAKLGELAFSQTVVFVDACFSGINRDNDGVIKGTRAVEIVAEEATLDRGTVVVFTAAQGNETAQAYPEKGHGLFTYYLLKELKDSRGDINFGSLSDHLTKNVKQQADQMKLRKKQTPAINTSEAIANRWREMQF